MDVRGRAMQRLIARPSDRLRTSVSNARRDTSVRQRRRWRWTQPLLVRRFMVILLGLSAMLLLTFYVEKKDLHDWLARVRQIVASATVRAGFAVNDILVVGHRNVTEHVLLEALNISPGTPLFFVDLFAARARVEALDWVRTAELRRRLPGQLQLRVYERDPVALWQRGSSFALVDDLGQPFLEAPIQLFHHLPVLVGSGAPKAYPQLSKLLASTTQLQIRLAAAIWVSERRWNLNLDNGLTVYLPETGVSEAWDLLVDQINTRDLFARDLVTIDLRQSGRLVIGVHPEAVWPDEIIANERALKLDSLPQKIPDGEDSPSKLAVGEHDA